MFAELARPPRAAAGTCGSHDRQQRQKDGRVASARGGARSSFHTRNRSEPEEGA